MQNDHITILKEYDGFTILVDEEEYHFSHNMEDKDYLQLCLAIQHITSDTIDIRAEESY